MLFLGDQMSFWNGIPLTHCNVIIICCKYKEEKWGQNWPAVPRGELPWCNCCVKYRTRHFSTEVAEQGGSQFKLRCSNHTAYYIHLKYMVRISKRLTHNRQEATRWQITPPEYWVTPCCYELSELLHRSVSLLTQTHQTSHCWVWLQGPELRFKQDGSTGLGYLGPTSRLLC